MARIRTIKPSFWGNAKVARCSNDARLLFVGLLNLADDEGRLLGSTRRIAGELFPHDDQLEITTVEGWLGELKTQGLVEAYDVDGIGYLALPGWHEHQRISHPAPSALPSPSGDPPEPLRPEREGEQGKGRGKGKGKPSAAPEAMTITEPMHAWLRENAPGVDYGRETSKFLDHHRKKDSRFVDWTAAWRNWMRNAHDWAKP